MNVIGADCSFWQEKIDFVKMKAAGAEFVILRAGQATKNWLFGFYTVFSPPLNL